MKAYCKRHTTCISRQDFAFSGGKRQDGDSGQSKRNDLLVFESPNYPAQRKKNQEYDCNESEGNQKRNSKGYGREKDSG